MISAAAIQTSSNGGRAWKIVAGEGERRDTDTSGLRIDDYVKVGFEPVTREPGDIAAEWMWVKVTAIHGDRVVGMLANEPDAFDFALSYRDTVRFEKRDIHSITPAA